jgi:predicted DNA-binding transcriptional regulator YafY
MSKSRNQLYRQWALLQKIPVRPAAKTAGQLAEELDDEGFKVSKRTIERDLNELKDGPFAVCSDEKGVGNNPNRWFFEVSSKMHLIPAMTPQLAFTLTFARKVLHEMLPPSVLRPMDVIFQKAEKLLKSDKRESYKHWQKYVKHVPRTLPLIPASVNPDVLENCLEALLKGCQLKICYQPRYDDSKEYSVNPLGLIFRDGVTYLVSTLWKYKDIKQLALHRIQVAEPLEDQRVILPPGFDLDRYIETEGAFLYPRKSAKRIKVELKFHCNTAKHLKETPLSEDQTINSREGYCHLKATVLDSQQLRWWLMGFGEHVEVLKPKALRDEFAGKTQKMAALYSR